jgi:hypothetical protein
MGVKLGKIMPIVWETKKNLNYLCFYGSRDICDNFRDRFHCLPWLQMD